MSEDNNWWNMKKYFILLICLMLLYTVVMSPVISTDEPVTVKIGVYENEPLIFTNENGKVEGIYADIIEYIAEEEGWNIAYVHGSWSECLHRLEHGEIDILTDIAYSEERSEIYDFSNETVWANWGRIYIQPGTSITSFLDLEQKRIAVVRGDIYYSGPQGIEHLMAGFDINCTFVEVDEYADALEAVENNSVAAGVVNRLFGMRFEGAYDIDKSPIVFSPTELKFAFPKNASMNPYLIERIDYHMGELKTDENSIYYQAINEYLGGGVSAASEERIPEWVKTVLMVSGGIILFLAAVGIVSRVQVKRKTAALKESEEKYRAIVEHSHDAIYIQRGTQFLFVNDRAAEITGYTKDELCDMNPFELLHPDDRERVEDIGRRRARGEDVPNTYQARVISKQGAVKYCEFAVTPITYKGEYAALGSVRDITRQKMAEDALRQSEGEKTLILDTSPALIDLQDTSHRVIWANRAAAESVGETPEDLEERKCYEIWLQRDEPCEGCPVEQAIETGEMQEGEMSTPDGRHWLIRGNPAKDDEGNIVGAVETALDITERKQAEQEMERALELEKRFKADASHFFLNPIAISKGYMELAMERMPEDCQEQIQASRDAIKRVEAVIKNIVEKGEIHE